MFRLQNFLNTLQEEAGAGDPGAGGGAGGGAGDPGAGDPGAGAGGAGDPGAAGGANVWQYAEGIDGMGDRPDYFLDKFTNMSEQAKAYKELEGRFGAFTGSPEKYSDVEGGNAYVAAAIQNIGADLNLDQGGYEQLVKEISTAVDGAAEAAYQKQLEDAEANIPNFDRRQKQLAGATMNILTPDQFASLDKAIVTPEGFAAVEALVSAAAGGLPGSPGAAPSQDTMESIQKELLALPASDVNGRNELVQKMNKLYGDGEGKLV